MNCNRAILVAVALLAGLFGCTVFFPVALPSWLAVTLGAALVFVMPGASLVCLLGVLRNNRKGAVVVSVVLSMTLVMLTGLAMYFVPTLHMDRSRWILLVTAQTVLLALSAAVVRTSGHKTAIRIQPRRRDLLRLGGSLLPAVLLLGIAGVYGYKSAAGMPKPRFTQLWATPAQDAVRIGVTNLEDRPVSYLLHVNADEARVFVYSLALADGESWEKVIPLPALGDNETGKRIEVTLAVAGERYPYRRVDLLLIGSPSGAP